MNEENSYVIVSDSSLDLPDSSIEHYGIQVVPYQVAADGEHFLREREEISVRQFYEEVSAHPNCYPKTSTPLLGDYIRVMQKALEKGKNIICLCMSAKFTSSSKTAQNAADLLKEEYEGEVEVMDSTLATALQGMFVEEAAKLQKAGIPFHKAVDRLKEIRKTGAIFFTVGNLNYLIHGGRIGKVKGAIANTIGLKPMILMKEGELFPMGTARSRKLSMKKMIDSFCTYIKDNQIDLNRCRIATGFGMDPDEGAAFHEMLKKRLKEEFNFEHSFESYQIGATLCVHTGPWPLGIGIIEQALPF